MKRERIENIFTTDSNLDDLELGQFRRTTNSQKNILIKPYD